MSSVMKNIKSAGSNFLSVSLILVPMSLLIACSSTPIDTTYRLSELHPVLKIPAGLDQPLSNPRLKIPEGANIDEMGRVAGIDELGVDFELPPQLKLDANSESKSDLRPAFTAELESAQPGSGHSKSGQHSH